MLDLLFPQKSKRAADWWGGGWGSVSSRVKVQAGVVVDDNLALTYAACWCATRIISETSASLPLFTYRRLSDRQDGGDVEHATDHYLYDLLKTSPNPEMESMPFREGRTMHQVNSGNGFAEIEWDSYDPSRRTKVIALWPIHPARVKPVRQAVDSSWYAEGYRYLVRNNDGTQLPLKADEMLHIPGVLSEDGIWGKGTVQHARETIGFGIGTERHGATQFGAGNMPRAVIQLPGMKDSEARNQFRREWKDIHGSPDSAEVCILPVEGKLDKLSFSNEDNQFLQTRVHNRREIATWYRLPGHMLGDLEKASYNSIEALSVEFVVYSLLPWLRRWEGQLNLKLILPQDRVRIYVEHQLAGLLRGDLKSRMEAHEIAIRNGILTINEARRLENSNGIGPSGDKHYVPMNWTTTEAMANPPPVAPAVTAPALPAPKGPGDNPPPPPAKPTAAKVLDVPDCRQEGDYDCGAAATMSVCQYFGVGPEDEADYIEELGTTEEDGTEPEAIVEMLNDLGLVTVSGQGMTVDDLRAFIRDGRPVICDIQEDDTPENDDAGHYVVAIGVDADGTVTVQDPLAGRVEHSAEDFMARWHDVEADAEADSGYGIAVGKDFKVKMARVKRPPRWLIDSQGQKQELATTIPAIGEPYPASTGQRKAARTILADALSRMFTKEAKAAERAAGSKITDWDAWLADFYGKHRETMTAALEPAAAMVTALGIPLDAEELAAQLIAESKTLLRESFDYDTKEVFAAKLARWSEERSRAVADAVFAPKKAKPPRIVRTFERDENGHIVRSTEEQQ